MIDVEETGNHSDSQPLPLTIALAPDQLEMLAARVADVFEDRRDEGFVDVDGAAAFLGMSRAAVCHLVERDRIPTRHRGIFYRRRADGTRAYTVFFKGRYIGIDGGE